MRTTAVALLAAIALGWAAARAAAPPTAPGAGKGAPRAGKAAPSKTEDDEAAARRLLKRADDLFLARETERAVKMIESVIEQYPASKAAFEAWLALGKHHVDVADYPAAITALRHLGALKKPDQEPTGRDLDLYLEGLYLTGIAHFQTRQFAAAFPILRKITNSYHNTVWAHQSHYYIGMCHFAQGNWNRAIEALGLVGTFVDPNGPAIEYAEAGRRFFVKIEDADLPVLFRLGKKPSVTLETQNGDKETLDLVSRRNEIDGQSSGGNQDSCFAAKRNRFPPLLCPLGSEAGIFIASIPTQVGVARPGDGVLQVIGGDTITAKYVDENAQDGRKGVVREKTVRVVSTATLRYTLGTFESNAAGAFLGQPLYLLLHDVDQDTTPEADTATVKLTSRTKRPRDAREELESERVEGGASRKEKAEGRAAAPSTLHAPPSTAEGDDDEQYVVRDEALLKLTELPAEAAGSRQGKEASPESSLPTAGPVHTGRFGGSVTLSSAREGQPPKDSRQEAADSRQRKGAIPDSSLPTASRRLPTAGPILTCAVGDEIVATYVDELHIGGEVHRQITATIQVVGEIDGRPRATQNIVPDPVLRARKLLVEATAYLELARIFRSMGLAKGAREKAVEGLERVESILREQGDPSAFRRAADGATRARSPIPPQLREEAFKLKWELHIVQDDFDNAIATCRLFNRLYPDSPFVDQALMGIATVRMERKEYADAIAVCRHVLALATSGAKAEAQFRIAEATEAIAAKALAARPLGAAKAPQQSEAAIQQYRICAEKFPESEFAGRSLAKLVDYYVEQNDFARAEDLLEQVFQDYPDSAFLDSMLLKWVLVAYRRGDFAKAYEKCSQLIFEYPASEHAKEAKELLPKIEEKVKGTGKAPEKEG